MNEGTSIEVEIAVLSQQIDAKRAELARERGGEITEREVMHHVVGAEIVNHIPTFKPLATVVIANPSAKSYLDDLAPADIAKINALIDLVTTKGLKQAILAAKDEPAYLLDAFHDALVDKLHDELLSKKLI